MKRISYILMSVLCFALIGCEQANNTFKTENFQYCDSTKYAAVSLDVDLPSGKSEVELQIKSTLIDLLQNDLLGYVLDSESDAIEEYRGSSDDAFALVQYYGKGLSTYANTLSKQDDDDRKGYIQSDETLSEEQKKEILDQIYAWEYNISLKELEQTDKYIVFSSSDYLYMGGAHGGVSGLGCMTFSKATGELIESFLVPSSEDELQAAMKQGLVQYFSMDEGTMTEEEMMENLFIDGGKIPFPTQALYPTSEGLVFTYQQYEIAAYAAGMPSFTLPYDVVAPYLTEEAKAIL